jgi:signal transduction histidine kinase
MDVTVARLKEISQAVLYASEGASLEEVLERIANVARELVNTRYAALGVPNGIGGLRYFKTTGMTPEEVAMLAHPPKGHGLIGAIMQERKSIRLERLQDDARSSGFPAHHPPMQSFLGVPVQIGQQLFGMLYLCDKQDGTPFNEADELLVETMAGYAALAIANTQANSAQHRMALLEERERISMELHDGIIQSLYAIGMQTQLLSYNDHIQPDALQPIVTGLDGVIEDIRNFILQLRERNDSGQTMLKCFQNIVARLYLPDSMSVHIEAPDAKPPFLASVFESVCLIVNEAVSNVARHASATHLYITAKQDGRTMVITVEDDGRGFDPEHPQLGESGGLGLLNMRHRARMYGGEVHIESALQRGTRLTIIVPMRSH